MLAREIVKQVRLRGPFYSLADFINREPQADSTDRRVKGALQAAIDAGTDSDFGAKLPISQINRAYFDPAYLIAVDDLDRSYAGRAASAGSVGEGSSGYLTQADLLAHLGPLLTTRSDTFLIRAYGETLDPLDGTVQARAWCEGVVQRYPDFVDAANAPETAVDDPDLTTVNQALGRQFRLISFRWLSEDDV